MASSILSVLICCVLCLVRFSFGDAPDVQIKIGEVFLNRHLLAQVNVSIANFYVNQKNGDLVFTEVISDDPEIYKLNILKSGAVKSNQIVGYLGRPQAITADLHNDIVYIGTTEGLYKLPKNSHKPVLFKEEGNDVYHVFFANKELYFIIYPDFKLLKYIWVNGVPKRQVVNLDFADQRVSVDKEGTLYYVDGLQILKKRPHGQSESVNITIPDNEDAVYDTTVDARGRLIFSAGNRIYTLKKGENVAKLQLTVNDEVEAIETDKHFAFYTVEEKKIYKYSQNIKLNENNIFNT